MKISSMRLSELKTMTTNRSTITLDSKIMESILDELIATRPITFEITGNVEQMVFASGKKYYVIAGIQSHLEMVYDRKVLVHVTELK